MLKRLGVLFAVVLSGALVAACGGEELSGSGTLETVDLDLSNFDSVEVFDTFDVFVEVGDDFSVSVTTDDNIVEHLMVQVVDGVLRLELKDDISVIEADLEAMVSMPELAAASVRDASSAEILGAGSTRQHYEVSGASELLIEGSADVLSVVARDASSVQLLGIAREISIEASEASDVDSDLSNVQVATVVASDASTVDVESAAVVSGELRDASELTVPEIAAVDVSTSDASTIDRS